MTISASRSLAAMSGVPAAIHQAFALVRVGGRVQISPNGEGGYTLSVLLEVILPGIEKAQAQALADAAHLVCPYSNATRGNIDVTITVSED